MTTSTPLMPTTASFSKLLRRFVGAVAAIVLTAAASSASAELVLPLVEGGQIEPMPIAVTDFHGATPEDARIGQDIARVVAADLERSGLFRPIDKGAFIQTPEQLQGIPRFADWRVINAQALTTGAVRTLPDGSMRVEFRLWDVFTGQQASGVAYTRKPSGWRITAHQIADEVYSKITGESGYFDTQIVYVAETGAPDKRVKRLAVMDQDGENHRFLTEGRELVLTPRFSPTQRLITYMSYESGQPRVYVMNVDTGRRELLGRFPGMTFAPRFAPDGNRVLMSFAQNGNTDIYLVDLRNPGSPKRLTDHPAIDTAPSFSPDGRQIVFESDRGGKQQLYVMNADGGDVQRISFGEGRYANPVWSPRGDLVAFIKQGGGQWSLGVMKPDGGGERVIAQAYHIEGPTWAPNGRVLMYFKEATVGAGGRGRSAKLYSIDLTGRNERQAATPLDGSDPAWSPLLLKERQP